MSISKEAIEAAARAMWNHGSNTGTWYWDGIGEDTRERYRSKAIAALTAAAPAIQAAAWDAVIARIDLGTPYMVDAKYVAGANWVRSQIEDVLKPTIEGKTK